MNNTVKKLRPYLLAIVATSLFYWIMGTIHDNSFSHLRSFESPKVTDFLAAQRSARGGYRVGVGSGNADDFMEGWPLHAEESKNKEDYAPLSLKDVLYCRAFANRALGDSKTLFPKVADKKYLVIRLFLASDDNAPESLWGFASGNRDSLSQIASSELNESNLSQFLSNPEVDVIDFCMHLEDVSVLDKRNTNIENINDEILSHLNSVLSQIIEDVRELRIRQALDVLEGQTLEKTFLCESLRLIVAEGTSPPITSDKTLEGSSIQFSKKVHSRPHSPFRKADQNVIARVDEYQHYDKEHPSKTEKLSVRLSVPNAFPANLFIFKVRCEALKFAIIRKADLAKSQARNEFMDTVSEIEKLLADAYSERATLGNSALNAPVSAELRQRLFNTAKEAVDKWNLSIGDELDASYKETIRKSPLDANGFELSRKNAFTVAWYPNVRGGNDYTFCLIIERIDKGGIAGGFDLVATYVLYESDLAKGTVQAWTSDESSSVLFFRRDRGILFSPTAIFYSPDDLSKRFFSEFGQIAKVIENSELLQAAPDEEDQRKMVSWINAMLNQQLCPKRGFGDLAEWPRRLNGPDGWGWIQWLTVLLGFVGVSAVVEQTFQRLYIFGQKSKQRVMEKDRPSLGVAIQDDFIVENKDFLDAIERADSRELSHHRLIGYIDLAIPLLGFIGTVIGISNALIVATGILSENLADRQEVIHKVTLQLGTAFDTTFVAIAVGLLLILFQHIGDLVATNAVERANS